jgi:hypothetical protein
MSHNEPPSSVRSSESEAEFLAHESRLAAEALRGALHDLSEGLHSAADVRLWTQQYPWLSVGVAAATGFAAAAVLAPATTTYAPAPQAPIPSPEPATTEAAEHMHHARSSALHGLLSPFWNIAKTAAEGWLMTALTTALQPPPQDTEDPHHDAPPDPLVNPYAGGVHHPAGSHRQGESSSIP